MAVPAPNGLDRDHKGKFLPAQLSIDGDSVMEIAAKLYGHGFRRPQVAKAIASFFPTERAAYRRVRKWERKQEFRDLVYKVAVVEMDMETPGVLQGITKAAKRGRVDAAKLHLAVTERYTDKSDQPQEVHIELKGLTRPDERELYGRKEEKKALPPPTSTTDLDREA